MTRKILSAVAMTVAVFFTGSLAAQAADVTFGGQLRPRYEVRHMTESTGVNNEAISMRTRLNTKVKVDDNVSAFIQFQMVSTWGGGGFDPFAANDTSNEVGMHQANFTVKNLFGMPVAAKIGRQEIILDGHRLFGNTGWAQGSQAHDALVLSHSHENMTVLYAWSKLVEDVGVTEDEANVEAHIAWANFKDLAGAGSSTSLYLVNLDDDSNHPGPSTHFWTVGARHAGGAGNVDYRGEFYYQTGKTQDIDMKAFMVGLRAGYKAANVSMKPKITLWGDYLSGTGAGATDNETFNTLFDTGHKFYGLQDLAGPNALGLIDLAIKLAIHPSAKTTLKVDLHTFERAEDVGPGTDDMGDEIDITLVHKYSSNVKIVSGYSIFLADANFAAEDPTWAYVMVDMTF